MFNQAMEKSLSKLMTKILRHTPEDFGVVLDPVDGSCPLSTLLKAIQAQPKWVLVKQEDIELVVRHSDKQRFEIEGGRIRARYGHSHDKSTIQRAILQPLSIMARTRTLLHRSGRKA